MAAIPYFITFAQAIASKNTALAHFEKEEFGAITRRLSNFVCNRPLESLDENQDYDWCSVVESRQQLMLEQGEGMPTRAY